MVIVFGTFVLVLAITGGLYWAFVERPESHEGLAIRRRLRAGGAARKLSAALLNEPQKLSQVGVLQRLLTRFGGVLDPLQKMISQSGLKLTVGTILLCCACAAALTFALVLRWLHAPFIAAAFAILAGWLPIAYVRMARTSRRLKIEEQFPEAIDLLGRALRAGHALTTGILMVAEEAAEPVGPEFKLLYDQQNFGLPLPQALKSFGERIGTLDAQFFVTAVLTQRESGGNLSEVLDNLATIIRDRFRVKRQVRVISAHGRITGWVLSALPTTLALFFAFSNPDGYRAFYTDPLGAQLVGGALFLQLIGIMIIRKIVRIEY
jgi:tight adherence protein B